MFETGAFTYASKLSSPFSSTLISSLAQEHCRHWPLQLLVVLVAWSWSGFDDGAAGRPGIKTWISQKLRHFCQDRLKILCVEEKKDSAITKFKVSVTVFDVTLEHNVRGPARGVTWFSSAPSPPTGRGSDTPLVPLHRPTNHGHSTDLNRFAQLFV